MPFAMSDILAGAIVRYHARYDKINENIVAATGKKQYILIENEEWQSGFSGREAINEKSFIRENGLPDTLILILDKNKKYSWIQLKNVICLTHPIKKDGLEELIKKLEL